MSEATTGAPAIQEGDKVSWSWGSSNPSGTAAEVKAGEVTVTSHRGNEISKTGTESNPAVHIERSGNDVVKTADELSVDKKAESSANNGTNATNGTNGTNGTSEPKKEEAKADPPKSEGKTADEAKSENPDSEAGKASTGEKRKADDTNGDNEPGAEKTDSGKKQKTEDGTAAPASAQAPATNGEKRKAGRPKGGAKKEKKAPAVGRAERKTRSQGTV